MHPPQKPAGGAVVGYSPVTGAPFRRKVRMSVRRAREARPFLQVAGDVVAVWSGRPALQHRPKASLLHLVLLTREVPAEVGDVDLTIYNVLGQPVRHVWAGPLAAGEHGLAWDGRDAQGQPVAAGVYLYRLQVGEQTRIRKMVKLE